VKGKTSIWLAHLRNGGRFWHLYEDFARSNRFQMEVVASLWSEYQRESERLTKDEKELLDRLANLRADLRPLAEFIGVSVDKEVIRQNSKP
jgi:Transmembrane secretion effector